MTLPNGRSSSANWAIRSSSSSLAGNVNRSSSSMVVVVVLMASLPSSSSSGIESIGYGEFCGDVSKMTRYVCFVTKDTHAHTKRGPQFKQRTFVAALV